MAYTVTTYKSEDDLATALSATIQTVSSEDALDDAIDLTTNLFDVIAKGGYFTIISDVGISYNDLKVIAKGGHYTVILDS